MHELELEQLKSKFELNQRVNIEDLKAHIESLQTREEKLLQDLTLKEEKLSFLQLELDNRESEDNKTEQLQAQITELEREIEYWRSIKNLDENESKNLEQLHRQIEDLKRENDNLKVDLAKEHSKIGRIIDQNKLLRTEIAKVQKGSTTYYHHPYYRSDYRK